MFGETEHLFSDPDSNFLWKLVNYSGVVHGIKLMDFLLHENISIVVGDDLFAFMASWDDIKISVTKIVGARKMKQGEPAPQIHHLANANHARYHFALAFYKESNSIYVTAGR